MCGVWLHQSSPDDGYVEITVPLNEERTGGGKRERRLQLKGCCQKWKAETEAEGQIRGALSQRCRGCLQEATELASACGMSRQVRDVLGFATMSERIMPAEAGMCRITTSRQPRSLSWIYVPIAEVREAIAARE